MLFIVIGTSLSMYAVYRLYSSQLEAYTSPQPVEIQSVDYTDQEVAAVKQRMEDFKAALDKGESPEQLILTADEINAIISSEKALKGKLFVKIEDGEIKGQASFPVPDGVPLGKGRYFNGSMSLKASLENGVLIVTIENADVNGKPVPEQFMNELRNQNLAKDAYNDPKSAEFLKKFESLTIEDNKLILTPAKKKPDDTSSVTPADATPPKDEGPAKAEVSENADLVPADQK
jgi:hypothetical protein